MITESSKTRIICITFLLLFIQKTTSKRVLDCTPGKSGIFKFLGRNLITLTPQNPTINFENDCFKENTITLKTFQDSSAVVNLKSSSPTSKFCSDSFLLTNIFQIKYKTKFFKGTTKIEIKYESEASKQYLMKNGIHLVSICNSLLKLFPDVLTTINFFKYDLFFSQPISDKKIEISYNKSWDLYEKVLGWQPPKRLGNIPREYQKIEWLRENIRSGDVICTRYSNAFNLLINWASGGICSHVGIFLWGNKSNSDKLYLLESNWKPGVAKISIEEYFKKSKHLEFSEIAILRLKSNLQKSFMLEKAWEKFEELDGLSYGFENLLFSLIDTERDNLTPMLTTEYLMGLLRALTRFKKGKKFVDTFFTEALNNRLKTKKKSFLQILTIANKQEISLGKILAMPELENYRYGAKREQRVICSNLVVSILKAGGVFKGIGVIAPEFTPRDVFELNIWEKDPEERPEDCIITDPDLPFCQIYGYRKFLAQNFSSVDPYFGMNLKCPSMAPDFFRPENC